MPRLDLVEAREPVHVRHAHVEQHEVGARLADEREHLRPGLRLADDLEAAVVLERPLDPVEDEPVVVGDHDAHGGSVAQGPDAPPSGDRCPRTGHVNGPGRRNMHSFEGFTCPDQGATLGRDSKVHLGVTFAGQTLRGEGEATGLRSAAAAPRSLSASSDGYRRPASNRVSRDGGMTDAAADTPAPRRSGIVGAVDRYFALVWVGLYSCSPSAAAAAKMLETCFDQSRDLEALRSVLADGRADAIADNLIGPAYIATAAALHWVARARPERRAGRADAAVVRARDRRLASSSCASLVRRLVPAPAPPVVSLAAQLVFSVLVFAAGTWHWSDVPWSHFFAAFLAVGFYALRFGRARSSRALLLARRRAARASRRDAELRAHGGRAAWALAVGVLCALRVHAREQAPRPQARARRRRRSWSTVAAVYAVTGKRELVSSSTRTGTRSTTRGPAPRGGRRRSRRSISQICP